MRVVRIWMIAAVLLACFPGMILLAGEPAKTPEEFPYQYLVANQYAAAIEVKDNSGSEEFAFIKDLLATVVAQNLSGIKLVLTDSERLALFGFLVDSLRTFYVKEGSLYREILLSANIEQNFAEKDFSLLIDPTKKPLRTYSLSYTVIGKTLSVSLVMRDIVMQTPEQTDWTIPYDPVTFYTDIERLVLSKMMKQMTGKAYYKLRVESSVAAYVVVNGRILGGTNEDLHVEEGEALVSLLADGYEKWEKTVVMTQDVLITASMKAIPPSAVLVVNSFPQNAAVFVDGVYAGKSPVTMPIRAGFHIVTIEMAGYETVEKNIFIQATDETVTSSVSLNQVQGQDQTGQPQIGVSVFLPLAGTTDWYRSAADYFTNRGYVKAFYSGVWLSSAILGYLIFDYSKIFLQQNASDPFLTAVNLSSAVWIGAGTILAIVTLIDAFSDFGIADNIMRYFIISTE